MELQPIIWVIPIAGLAAIAFALYLARDVLRADTGTAGDASTSPGRSARAPSPSSVASTGPSACSPSAALCVIGIVIARRRGSPRSPTPTSIGLELGITTGIAFLVGAACSMASGIIGMCISVQANLRTAAAAQHSLVRAVQVAMRGGAVSGFLVVALSLLGVCGIFAAFGGFTNPEQAPFLIVGFGFGASFVALFAQLGGGIYTKAADVGADLVGKVEAGIPEDDPRNAARRRRPRRRQRRRLRRSWRRPLRVDGRREHRRHDPGRRRVAASPTELGWPNPEAWIFFPLVVRGFGLLATIVAMFFVRGREDENPMNILNRGYWATTHPVGRGARVRDLADDADGRYDRRQRPAVVDLVLRRRRGRAGDQRRLRLHHPVLHRRLVPARARDRRGQQDRSRHEHHQRHRGRLRDDRRHRHHHRHRAVRQLLPRRAGARRDPGRRGRRRRHLRHRGGDDGHAHDHGLHPGHGHLRTDHRQRRRHRPVQPRRREGARDHRPARRGRQHDQGAHQGLRDRARPRWRPSCCSAPTSTRSTSSCSARSTRGCGRRGRCSSRSTSPTSTSSSRP